MSDTQKHTKPNVPNLRFPVFEGEWEQHLLSEYLEFKNGLNPSAKSFGEGIEGIKFISVMDILNNPYITYDCIRASVNATEKEKQEFYVEYGDILFQRSSETLEDVGHANVYLDRKPALFGGFTIRGKKKGDYNPLFFKYLLDSPKARKKVIVKGAGAQHFNIGQEGLSSVSLFFPAMQEQNKIAVLLELLDQRIAIQNKVIEKYESLIKALYRQLIPEDGDEHAALGTLVQICKGKQLNGEYLSDNGKYYVMNGGITPSGYYDDYNTSAGTISISEGGNSCGFVQYNEAPFWSGGHCYTLLQTSNERIQYKFLYHFLKSKQEEIMSLRIGSGLPNIQKKDLGSYPVPILPYNYQIVITKILDAVCQHIEIERVILDGITLQKQYFLQALFI